MEQILMWNVFIQTNYGRNISRGMKKKINPRKKIKTYEENFQDIRLFVEIHDIYIIVIFVCC
jgi:hypothetical protein